jgi:hypothetical protein
MFVASQIADTHARRVSTRPGYFVGFVIFYSWLVRDSRSQDKVPSDQTIKAEFPDEFPSHLQFAFGT